MYFVTTLLAGDVNICLFNIKLNIQCTQGSHRADYEEYYFSWDVRPCSLAEVH
jgi:hypothetical protein